MKLKIISNGEPYGAKVVNADTGENIENIIYVNIRMDADDGGIPHVEIGLVDVPISVVAEDIKTTPPGFEGFLDE